MISSSQTNHPLAGLSEPETQKADELLGTISAKLKAAGLRHTQPRLAIYRTLSEFNEPVTIEQIFHSIKNKSCDLVTVYRSLALFEELGLVQRSFSKNGTGLYELKRSGDPLYFVTNKNTGHREALSAELTAELRNVFAKIEQSLADRGYRELTHRVEIQGTTISSNPITAEIISAARQQQSESIALNQS